MQLMDSIQEYTENVKNIVNNSKLFPSSSGMFRIVMKPERLKTGETELRRYFDSTGFLCVCGGHVVFSLKGETQVFDLAKVEKLIFWEKDAVEICSNVQKSQL